MGVNSNARGNDDARANDDIRMSHVMAMMSITIFLTLCLIVGDREKYLEFDTIKSLLWCAVGFFGASSLRFMDCLYDNVALNKNKLFAVGEWNNKYFLAVDYRFTSLRFICYFAGWISFISAHYYLGAKIFGFIEPSAFSDYLAVATHKWYTIVVTGLLIIATILATTRQIFFIE